MEDEKDSLLKVSKDEDIQLILNLEGKDFNINKPDEPDNEAQLNIGLTKRF